MEDSHLEHLPNIPLWCSVQVAKDGITKCHGYDIQPTQAVLQPVSRPEVPHGTLLATRWQCELGADQRRRSHGWNCGHISGECSLLSQAAKSCRSCLHPRGGHRRILFEVSRQTVRWQTKMFARTNISNTCPVGPEKGRNPALNRFSILRTEVNYSKFLFLGTNNPSDA